MNAIQERMPHPIRRIRAMHAHRRPTAEAVDSDKPGNSVALIRTPSERVRKAAQQQITNFKTTDVADAETAERTRQVRGYRAASIAVKVGGVGAIGYYGNLKVDAAILLLIATKPIRRGIAEVAHSLAADRKAIAARQAKINDAVVDITAVQEADERLDEMPQGVVEEARKRIADERIAAAAQKFDDAEHATT